MTFSSLTARTVNTRKYNDIGARRRVDRLIVHHTAGGTNEGNVHTLSASAAEVSATYCLLTNADLVGIVPEEFRPWTSNAPGIDADWNAVTVETVNTGGAPNWPVSEAQVEKLAQLAADLCRRYDWGTVTRSRVIGHQEVGVATACPGPYLLPRLDHIVSRANEILRGSPAPATQKGTIVRAHVQRRDRRAERQQFRTLKCKSQLYLFDRIGEDSNATSIARGAGAYLFVTHLYATGGKPGEGVDICLVWQDAETKRNSQHYVQRAVFDGDGVINDNTPFIRPVKRGENVFLRLRSPSKNTRDVRIELLGSDAYLFATG